MARLNIVIQFGKVLSDPIISIDNITHEPIKASLFLSVVNQARDSGINESEVVYSEPFIYTQDPEIIKEISKWKKGDLVDVQGVLTTLDAKRGVQCISCGQKILRDGEVTVISPSWAELRYSGLTDVEADEMLKRHREISNRVYLMGYLTKNPTETKKPKFYSDLISRHAYKGLTSFQIAVNRSLFIKSDDPLTKTDYPHVVSIGSKAEEDMLALHEGSLVAVDGMVATRAFRRTHTCPFCQVKFDREEKVTEVLTYNTEYLANFNVFEGSAGEERQRRKDAALQMALGSLGIKQEE